MIDNRIIKGLIYFRQVGDENEIIRITRIKNRDTVSIKNIVTGNCDKITIEDLKHKYVKLNPNGFITFSLADLDNDIKDVMCIFLRREDIDNNISTPYAVCRQNILDLFANQIYAGKQVFMGISISKDTCPKNIDFNMTLACNGLNRTETIAVYYEDTMDDILSFVNSSIFDQVLKTNKNKIIKLMRNEKIKGFNSSLKQLVEENDFMYDIHKGFHIYELPFELHESKNLLSLKEKGYIENEIIRKPISSILVSKYTKYIKLDHIQREYFLAVDKNKKLFIIAYDINDDPNIELAKTTEELNVRRNMFKYYSVN